MTFTLKTSRCSNGKNVLLEGIECPVCTHVFPMVYTTIARCPACGYIEHYDNEVRLLTIAHRIARELGCRLGTDVKPLIDALRAESKP